MFLHSLVLSLKFYPSHSACAKMEYGSATQSLPTTTTTELDVESSTRCQKTSREQCLSLSKDVFLHTTKLKIAFLKGHAVALFVRSLAPLSPFTRFAAPHVRGHVAQSLHRLVHLLCSLSLETSNFDGCRDTPVNDYSISSPGNDDTQFFPFSPIDVTDALFYYIHFIFYEQGS